jgi:micrococcal nuclease
MYKYRALCVKIIDGDTIDAFIDLGFDLWTKKRIRLFGINTPEIRTKNLKEKQKGIAAKGFLKLTLEKNNFQFILLSHGVGKYGRCLGELFIDDINVNKLLIKEGHAKTYKE